MPHVEVRGPVRLSEFHARFAPRSLREGRVVTKALQCFLSHDQRTLLLDLLVVEGDLRQSFFLILNEREDSVMVRLLPRTAPEKTPGVRRAVAWIGTWLSAVAAGSALGTTNLPDSLRETFPAESIAP